jgi:orotidine-5'-phosphate decarboxylase
VADVIIPLDVPSRDQALALVELLGDQAGFYKVGLELYTRAGPGVIGDLRAMGKRVFLDLKLHDIPNTVARAVVAASEWEVDLLTVHTAGGAAMMEAAARAAREAAREEPAALRILGVTLLTSFTASDVEVTWGRTILSLRDEVVRLSELARDSGLNGVVASALEAQAIRRHLGADFLIVTPGIRLPGGEAHDQSRVATPGEAVELGADLLVVGRAVTEAPDPRAALARVYEELAAAHGPGAAPRGAEPGGGRES